MKFRSKLLNKISKVILPFAMSGVVAPHVLADDGSDSRGRFVLKPYFMSIEGDVKNLPSQRDYETNHIGIGFGLAYEPVPWLGVELRRAFREDAVVFFDWDELLQVSSWDASMYFQTNLNKVLFLRFKGGYSDWEAEAIDDDEFSGENVEPWTYKEDSSGLYFSAEGGDFFGAIGIGFNIKDRSNITLDYEIIDTDAYRFETIALGFGFKI